MVIWGRGVDEGRKKNILEFFQGLFKIVNQDFVVFNYFFKVANSSPDKDWLLWWAVPYSIIKF